MTTDEYLDVHELRRLPTYELRGIRDDATELREIVLAVPFDRPDLNRSRRELPRLIRRIDRVLGERRIA